MLEQAETQRSDTIEGAVARFYAALEVFLTGDLRPMTEVWSHAEDVTYLSPSGTFRVGWGEVFADWKEQAELKLGGRVKPRDVHLLTAPGAEVAVVQNREVGEIGSGARVDIRVTNVFRREEGSWKMVSHHADLLPFLH
ncbi:MAG: nuclear transport factor 2 family protein [Myxococcaceae bacterium]